MIDAIGNFLKKCLEVFLVIQLAMLAIILPFLTGVGFIWATYWSLKCV